MCHEYPAPGNEHEMEDFCLRYYRFLLKREGLVHYGKRGEKQDGIDVIDQHGQKPVYAIQSKRHEPHKTIPPAEIKAEVGLAENSQHEIDHYLIATTAKKSRNAQDTILELNKRASKKFLVEIHFWEDICTRLNEFGRAIAELLIYADQPSETNLHLIGVETYRLPNSLQTAEIAEGEELYPEIIELLKDRKLEAAEHEIEKLPPLEETGSLDSHRRYAILRLKAKLQFELCNFDEASRLFLSAYDILPKLSQARQNRVLALDLAGQEEAGSEAKLLLDDGICTASVLSTYIRSTETIEELSEYQQSIDELAESDEVLNETLARQYLSWGKLELAKAAANRALEISPTSAHALFTRGTIAHNSIVHGNWEDRPKHIRDALHLYTEAEEAAKRDNYNGLLSEIYSNRGRVNGVAGNSIEAANDFRTSVEQSDKPSGYAEGAVSYFLHEQEYASAWEYLTYLDASSDEAQFLQIATKYHYGAEDDKKNQIQQMLSLADSGVERAPEARYHCVQWALDLRDFDLARKCVPDALLKQRPFQGHTLLGWIEYEQGNTDVANEHSQKALEVSSRSADREDLATLARLLVELENDEDAFPLLEHVYTPGVLDLNTKRLLECAQQLERHDLLIRVCSELRNTGQHDNRSRRLEVQVLSRYSPEEAFDLAKEFLQFERLYFSVVKNYLAVRLNREDEVQFDQDSQRRLEDFGPDEADLVLVPYVAKEKFVEARDYIYQLLRSDFSSELAHGKYIWFVFQYGTRAEIDAPSAVDRQSAVRLKNLVNGEHRWITIEDHQPEIARDEFSSSSPTGQALLGKRVGDIIDLHPGHVQKQEEEIVEIQTKFVRLFQDAISNFQHRFPDSTALQSLHVGSGDDFDISAILQVSKERREYVEQAFGYYRSNPCSLHLLAKAIGINEGQVMIALAEKGSEHIQCVGITAETFSEAVESQGEAEKVVLDVTAIVTISQLRSWDLLDQDKRYFVSRTTSDLIDGWLRNLENEDTRPSAHSFYTDDGKLLLQDASLEQIEQECESLREVVEQIKSHCTVRSSSTVASLDLARRELFADACGYHTLEALSLAKDNKAAFWTDDRFVAMIAEADFGLKRIWSQLAFESMRTTGKIEYDQYSEITAKLAAWNYVSTLWHVQDIITAGKLSNWTPTEWPFEQCLQLIKSSNLPVPKKTHMVLAFFKLLRKSDCLELKQTAIVQAILDALNSVVAVKWMLQEMDGFFGIDIPSADFLKLQLAYWLKPR